MPASLRFIPGTTIRWRSRRFVIVDYAGLDALVAREIGKRRLDRVPLNEAVVDLTPGDRNAWTPDLVSVENKAWQIAVRRFKLLKPLLELSHAERTFAKVNKIAFVLGNTRRRYIDGSRTTSAPSGFQSSYGRNVRIGARVVYRTRSMPLSNRPSEGSI